MSHNFDILHQESLHREAARNSVLLPKQKAPRGERTGADGIEEEIAKLVQRLFLVSATRPAPTAVAFCGVDANAGCTFVCARTAEALAEQVSARVCAVDGNLRAPHLHDHFRLERRNGLADAIKGTTPLKDIVQPTWTPNLWLLSAGTTGSEPATALHPVRLRNRFAELRNEFDYVLIDTPALSSYADAAVFGLLADGVVLVVGSDVTRREPARRAKDDLEAAKVPILGAVLNRRSYPIPEALYRIL